MRDYTARDLFLETRSDKLELAVNLLYDIMMDVTWDNSLDVSKAKMEAVRKLLVELNLQPENPYE